jgi:MGT family glycosyltransferase
MMCVVRKGFSDMACIAIVVEHEEGHLIPTFRLARRLQERGHQVVYLGPEDGADFVCAQGFTFEPILRGVLPRGSIRTQRAMAEASESGDRAAEYALSRENNDLWVRVFCDLAEGEDFDRVVQRLQPDLFLFTSLFATHALVVHYRYGLPVSFITPMLRVQPKSDYAFQAGRMLDLAGPAGERVMEMVRRVDPEVRQREDLAARLMAIRELILCPADFELDEVRHDREPEVHYVEASVDLASKKGGHPFPWERLDPERKLLYVSLGSQSYRLGRPNVVAFLSMVTEVFAARPDWQVVLTTGGLIDPGEIPAPSGTVVVSWAPQLDLLRRARVAITHGGLGTVKDCIFLGVPMVVFPISHDQPANAFRVLRHQLGFQGNFQTASPSTLLDLVVKADQDDIRAGIERMRRRFMEVEESGVGVRLIEELLH